MKPSEEPIEIPESVQRGVIIADQVTGNVITEVVMAENGSGCLTSAIGYTDFGQRWLLMTSQKDLFNKQLGKSFIGLLYTTGAAC